MQARLRAQLGDRPKYSGERRRRSVVVASIVLTITDPLRGSYPLLCNLQAALIRSCGASFACMELTIISRFQRLQASTKYLLHSLFYCFSVLSFFREATFFFGWRGCDRAPALTSPPHDFFLRFMPQRENSKRIQAKSRIKSPPHKNSYRYSYRYRNFSYLCWKFSQLRKSASSQRLQIYLFSLFTNCL